MSFFSFLDAEMQSFKKWPRHSGCVYFKTAWKKLLVKCMRKRDLKYQAYMRRRSRPGPYNLHLPHSLSMYVQTSLTLGNNLIVTLSLSKCHFDLTKLTCKRSTRILKFEALYFNIYNFSYL